MKKNQRNDHLTKAERKAYRVTSAMPMPQGYTHAAMVYYRSLPEEIRQQMKTTTDLANHAGVMQRIASVLSAYYVLAGAQSMLFAEIEGLMDDWGISNMLGVKPAINAVHYSEDNFFRTMRQKVGVSNGNNYTHDVDYLLHLVHDWQKLPEHWEPGDPIYTHNDNDADSMLVHDRNDLRRLRKIEKAMSEELKSTKYGYGKIYKDETLTLEEWDLPNRGLCTIRAKHFAKEHPGAPVAMYKVDTYQSEVCKLTPVKAIVYNQHTDETSVVSIDNQKKTS